MAFDLVGTLHAFLVLTLISPESTLLAQDLVMDTM